jgi:hypothetical protein
MDHSAQGDWLPVVRGPGRWLARFFPASRAIVSENGRLREAVQQLTQEKLLLQDRLDASNEERSRVWSMMQQALEGERMAYQMHINQSWQRTTGTVPYPDAPHAAQPKPVPANPEPLGRAGRILPSDRIARRTEEYLASTFANRA